MSSLTNGGNSALVAGLCREENCDNCEYVLGEVDDKISPTASSDEREVLPQPEDFLARQLASGGLDGLESNEWANDRRVALWASGGSDSDNSSDLRWPRHWMTSCK